jgi:hypothetical protein
VAAFALFNENIDNVAHTASAGVEMVTFEAILHGNADDPDDRIDLGEELKVAVDTAVTFDFHQLDAGNFLWAAVGTSASAMLITGQDLNVIDVGGKQGGKVNSGSDDPTDTVNTSKATDTTIGINAQHFAPTNTGDGATAVFTFVSGLDPLELTTPQYTGQNIKQIQYEDYVNVSKAAIFISQLTGSGAAKIKLSLFEAGGGGPNDMAPADLQEEEGYNSDPNNKYSYIGEQNEDTNLKDDTPVALLSVKVTRGADSLTLTGSGQMAAFGITATFDGNSVILEGVLADDLIELQCADDSGSDVDGTFNRIDVQAMFGSASFDIGYIKLNSGGVTPSDLGDNLYLDDDGPAVAAAAAADPPNDLEVANQVGASDSSAFILSPGSDGQGSYTIVGPEDNAGSFQWTYDDDTVRTSITGTYLDAESNALVDLYTLTLNADGSYDFVMIGELPGSSDELNPNEVIKAGAPDAPILEIGLLDNDDYVRMSASGGNINESHGFVGVTNGNLDPGESLTFTLWADDQDPPTEDTQFTFEGITIGTKSAQGGTYSVSYHVFGGGWVTGSNEVVGKNGTIVVDATDLGGATIDAITIGKISGPATKIGIGDIAIIRPPDDVQLGFTVELKDGDGDAATASFVVDIDGDGDGAFEAGVNALSLPAEPGAFNQVDYFLV